MTNIILCNNIFFLILVINLFNNLRILVKAIINYFLLILLDIKMKVVSKIYVFKV